MSDHDETQAQALLLHLANFYAVLADVCLSLPIPIRLPAIETSYIHIVDGVSRAYTLFTDQPLPEQDQETLTTAALQWLSASELIVTFEMEAARYKVDAATMNMISGMQYLDAFREAQEDLNGN
ncbi:hypothetical protein AB0I84_12950 [Streptomyces spectabilis]|uniref:hypothetical protein n=1 Tax=Streptomyces spectabilis TaxID=68270 RepID=UPI0033EFA513